MSRQFRNRLPADVQARLERYAKKVRVAGNELDLSQSSRSLTVDVAAANRFIDAVIPDLDRRQSAKSQEARLQSRAASFSFVLVRTIHDFNQQTIAGMPEPVKSRQEFAFDVTLIVDTPSW